MSHLNGEEGFGVDEGRRRDERNKKILMKMIVHENEGIDACRHCFSYLTWRGSPETRRWSLLMRRWCCSSFAEPEVGVVRRQEAAASMLVVASSLPAHTTSIVSMFSCGQWHASRA